MDVYWFALAISAAIYPSLFLSFLSAPFKSNFLTTLLLPLIVAKWRADNPSAS